MAKITELEPSDSNETTSRKSSKECKGESRSSRPDEKEEKSASVSLQNTTGTLYINYILLPIVIVIISIAVLFTTNQTAIKKTRGSSKKGMIMTAVELAKHDGSDPNVPVYIAILGRVYDVEKGRRHYGKGSGYNIFAGRDSTPSFVTGMFSMMSRA
jgi:predicted heme/steroid binding protein